MVDAAKPAPGLVFGPTTRSNKTTIIIIRECHVSQLTEITFGAVHEWTGIRIHGGGDQQAVCSFIRLSIHSLIHGAGANVEEVVIIEMHPRYDSGTIPTYQ